MKTLLIKLTILFLVILFADCIWEATSKEVSDYSTSIFVIMTLLLVVSLVVNLLFAILKSEARSSHIILSLLILVMFIGVFPLTAMKYRKTHLQWFVQEGRQKYDFMAGKVVANSSILTGKYQSLDAIVARSHVYGRTNIDGSIIVWFFDIGGNPRAGYLFYSGNKMIPKPDRPDIGFFQDNPERYFRHLTNNWYEYY